VYTGNKSDGILTQRSKSMSERVYYSREAELRAKREQTIAFLLFMGIGLLVGALIALLFAPGSGRETREGLASTVEDGLGAGREVTMKTLNRLEREFADLRKRIEERLN
jgi:hypothetical protein